MAKQPSVEEVRPQRCLGCRCRHGATDCRIYGHGLRARIVLGPLDLDTEPSRGMVQARRYRCTACGCVMLVVPRELGPYVRYHLPAILFALALFAIEHQRADAVRAAIAPITPTGFREHRLWPSLRRWTRQRDRLFGPVAGEPEGTVRERAASLVLALIAAMPNAPPLPKARDAWRVGLLA